MYRDAAVAGFARSSEIREVLEEIGVWREAPRAAGAHRPPQGEMFESDPEADSVDPPPGSDDAA